MLRLRSSLRGLMYGNSEEYLIHRPFLIIDEYTTLSCAWIVSLFVHRLLHEHKGSMRYFERGIDFS